jgi:hypothetical protein
VQDTISKAVEGESSFMSVTCKCWTLSSYLVDSGKTWLTLSRPTSLCTNWSLTSGYDRWQTASEW